MINERNGAEYFSKVNMNGEEVEEINETSDGGVVVAKSGPHVHFHRRGGSLAV